MFAIIKTGGKQYKVTEGSKFLIEKLNYAIGEEFDFEEVLLIGNAKMENAQIGAPLVDGAKVHARVLDHGKAKKKIIFKFKNKTRYWKKKGHRQPFTKVEILKITA
ncbi:MAG: 50S ribosomal protein L21 [Candidatus Yanofskybacteria bacterium]|nr:50S ribosomal protein L21 [Candidatus Yanofskybacteria bacterium]